MLNSIWWIPALPLVGVAINGLFGKRLSFDSWGPPHGSWILRASLGRAAIPLQPWGTLWLDPTTMAVMGVGGFDLDGHDAMAFHVPNLASLVGVDVFWQASTFPENRLGNRETTTLSGL